MFAMQSRLAAFFGFVFIFLLVATACAQNLEDVKSRMVDRKPSIDTLKGQGLVGEGNDGYLHVRKADANAQKVTDAENADRKAVYQAIAGKQGVALDVVGKRRALQLLELAEPGHLVQKGDGSWVKK